MAKGWICLHRELQDNSLWKSSEPFDRRSAWVDLLLTANHEDRKIYVNGEVREIKRGQTLTSILKLSERWGWSRGKTKRFLDVLESEQMVTLECSRGGTTNGTTLTIVNYGKFQDLRTTDSTTDDTTDGQRMIQRSIQRTDINNNYNNENKENNENNENNMVRVKFTPPTIDDVRTYVFENNINIDPEAFFDHFTSNGWLVGGRSKMKDWKAAVRNWERNDRKWSNSNSNSKKTNREVIDWSKI